MHGNATLALFPLEGLSLRQLALLADLALLVGDEAAAARAVERIYQMTDRREAVEQPAGAAAGPRP